MRIHVDKTKAPHYIINGVTYYFVMPISKFACVVLNDKNEAFTYYHFKGLKETNKQARIVGMPCQQLCGRNGRLRRIHISCFRCGYRRAYMGKMPRLLKIKMIYQIYIPTGITCESIKDRLRKLCLTLAESLST